MNIFFSGKFEKQYKKLSEKLKDRFDERLAILQNNPQSRSLNLHTVIYKGDIYTSMNVTGDYRAFFQQLDGRKVRFHAIGTHSQLYG